MTESQAQKTIGNQARVFTFNMAKALSLYSCYNSPADWERLEAACTVLGRGAPRNARECLQAHKAAIGGNGQ